LFSDAAFVGAINAAGANSAKTNGFATGLEAGYNWQNGPFLLGVEADLQSLHLNGAASSGAIRYPGGGGQFVVTSYSAANWLFTARARAGLVAGNGALFFLTGGLAVTHLNTDFVFSPANGVAESGKLDAAKAGYVIGGGGEAPLTDRLSVKAEYLYVKFSDTTTSGNLAAGPAPQAFTHTGNLAANILRLGLNYRFAGFDRRPEGVSLPVRVPAKMPAWQTPAIGTDWEVEAGARVWFSSGTIGAPQPLLDSTGALASRITFEGQDAVSGETFARIDHASGVFVKGFLGAGAINRGTMNDEDFPATWRTRIRCNPARAASATAPSIWAMRSCARPVRESACSPATITITSTSTHTAARSSRATKSVCRPGSCRRMSWRWPRTIASTRCASASRPRSCSPTG
jgi:opacity protein-like surface antigen